METYKNIPKLSTIERIAEALNVPVIELFRSSEHKVVQTISDAEMDKENERKQRIRTHIKNEIINKISNNLDDILQII